MIINTTANKINATDDICGWSILWVDPFPRSFHLNLKTRPRESLKTDFKHYIPESHWCITQAHHYIISLHLKILFKPATLCSALWGRLDSMFWCFRALQASVLWSLIASQPLLCGENEVEVDHSGLSKAHSHRSQSGALTPTRFLMDFRRPRQTHSWAPNKLIRAPQICGSPDRRTAPHDPASPHTFSTWEKLSTRN